jgi:hypothetical protein
VLTLGELVVRQDVTIESVPSRTPTISGDGISRVFEISASANVTLDNLKIIDGNGVADNPGGNGGAILNFGTLMIDSVALGSNAPIFAGGGIFSLGTLTVTGSTRSGNSAFVAGDGIFNEGMLTVSDSNFETNHASALGGGLFNIQRFTLGLHTPCRIWDHTNPTRQRGFRGIPLAGASG